MSRGLPDFKYYLVSRRGTSDHTRAHDAFKTNCTMVETIVVNGLTTNLTDTWRNSGNARRRQGPACVHRLEDGVKKHRGLTAASSSHRVSRHVTLRTAPSTSVEVPTRAYQPRGRDVPAHAIRSRGCQCALYICMCRSPCLRTMPSYHQRAARAILEGWFVHA